MKTSERLDQIAAALSAALGEMQDVVKSTQGYGYKYASLDQLTSMSLPVLARHGLALLQEATATDVGACVTTRVLHASGQWVETLRGPLGDANAILVQTIPSCLVHIGKPEGEILGSIAVGILFGSIALRTGSIWYVFVLHAAIGLLTDWFILFL